MDMIIIITFNRLSGLTWHLKTWYTSTMVGKKETNLASVGAEIRRYVRLFPLHAPGMGLPLRRSFSSASLAAGGWLEVSFGITDGIGTPDPNPKRLVKSCV